MPLPIFYAEDGTEIITPETIERVAQLFAEHGSNVWFEWDAKDLLPAGFTHPGSPNGEFTKEKDIMDVWFDSGSSHQAVLAARDELTYPADLILEGSDQYRGWFNSSLITSVAVGEVSPYKAVISQGFVLDGNGRKMSKSLGNTILPEKIIKQMGADIVRLWVASVDASSDVKVTMENFQQVSEAYRKIRNTMRFMIANTTDFDPAKDTVDYAELGSVDKFMLVRLNAIIESCKAAYDAYDFATVYKTINMFLTNELSAFYLDFAKDVVYIDGQNDAPRRNMQTVFYAVAVALTKLLTPILPHTAEEIWSYLHEPEEFVQLAEMPEVAHFAGEEDLVATWNAFMGIRDDVLKALETARMDKVIGKSLEAAVTLYPNEANAALLASLDADVKQLLIVSQLTIADQAVEAPAEATQFDGVAVSVAHAEGDVCDRCRMIKTDVGSDDKFPMLCARCAAIVTANYPEAVAEGLEK